MRNVGATRGLLTLLAVATIAGLLVSGSDYFSRDRIAANERQYLLQQLSQVVSPDLYDNDLAANQTQVQDPALLGMQEPADVYVGTRAGKPAVLLFTVNAPDGYNGNIRLLVGVMRNGQVTGVRVISHRETPGLGDAIEISRSNWIAGFAGRSLGDPPPEAWAVRADGGEFDQLTGATITARAVINAVRNTLIYFEQNQDELLQMPVTPSPETP